MAAKAPALVAAQTIRIPNPKTELGYKCVVQLKLNGGTCTLVPKCILSDTADLVPGADDFAIEYNVPSASATKLTANITAAGIYEFFLDGKDLTFLVSAVTGVPTLYYDYVKV